MRALSLRGLIHSPSGERVLQRGRVRLSPFPHTEIVLHLTGGLSFRQSQPARDDADYLLEWSIVRRPFPPPPPPPLAGILNDVEGPSVVE